METQNRKASITVVQISGYVAAWTVMTLALTLAFHRLHVLRAFPTFHLYQNGPCLPNPLPYAAIAMGISLIGRLLRKWIHS